MSYAPMLTITGASGGLPMAPAAPRQDQYSRIWSEAFKSSLGAMEYGTAANSTATGKSLAVDVLLAYNVSQNQTVADLVNDVRSFFGLNAIETGKALRVSRQMVYHYQEGIEPMAEKKRRLAMLAKLANEWQGIDPALVKSYLHTPQPEGKTLLDYLEEDQINEVAVREIIKRARSPDRRQRENLAASLGQGETLEARRDIAKERQAAGKPVYIADPDDPSKIIQVLPDGSQIRGALVNRRFVPEA